MNRENKFNASERYVIEVDGHFYPATEYELHMLHFYIGELLKSIEERRSANAVDAPESCPYPGEHNFDLVVEGRIRSHEIDELRKEIEALKRTIAELQLRQPVFVPMPYASPWGTPLPQQPWLGPWANTSSGLTTDEIKVTVESGVDVAKLAYEVAERINLMRKGT